MSLASYNTALGAYGNVKSNVLADKMAKNRWGNKFKRLYSSLKDEDNKVDFTQGMLNCAGTDVQGIIAELEALSAGLNAFFTLSDDSTAKPNSYFTLLCGRAWSSNVEDKIVDILDVKLSLSIPAPASDTDARRVSKIFQKSSNASEATSYIEPIDSYYVRKESNNQEKPFYVNNQLTVFTEDGTQYGHIDANYTLVEDTNFSNISALYGVEKEDDLFLENYNYEDEFNNLFSTLNLEKWLLNFANVSYSWESHTPNYGEDISIVFGADLILAWLHEILSSWYAYMNGLNEVRAGKELELINHLSLCDTLQEQIGDNAGQISSIWFEFKKEVSPPRKSVREQDPNYKWWKEKQFNEVRKHFKNFHNFCNYNRGESLGKGRFRPATVTLKNKAFNLSGNKIYWLVSALLGIDSRTKKRSFLERLFSFALLVVSVYLTAITANPAWMKIVLITITFANYAGALSPKAQLAFTAVMFAYGLSNANLSAMNSAQIFQWAINNIEMVLKMVQLYETVKLEDEGKNEEKNPHEVQEQAMQFIYSDAYSQYDNFYSVMYDYEPKI
ncbi:hypothetical protein MNB_SV-13-128 [hydrothermal vent metagenome]|uniref:Uncharacterized protein n=1 Tax=hydrothermal vent metagenome TaxID=652676 RepID=A0A1W1CYX1_9ZZZZ